MKIVCEACGAKYSISDDKVRGKVFKIRCKKCSHIIVVRGNEDGGPIEAEVPQAAQAPADQTAGADAVWYVVVEGEQVGPLTEADVAARVGRGEVSSETFAWREGMADWIQISAIAEFAGSLAAAPPPAGMDDADSPFAPQPTAVYPPGTAESIFGDEGDALPSPMTARSAPSRSEGTEVFGAPASVGKPSKAQDLFAPQSDYDSFSAPAPTAISPVAAHMAPAPVSLSSLGGMGASSGGGFFPSSAPVPAAAGAGLTGQRSENSVLFSLSNLESLAGGHSIGAASSAPGGRGFSSAPAPVTEGSGLIDIRSMAAMTMGKQARQPSMFGGMPMASPELPTFSAGPIAPLAPMLLPSRQSEGLPTWVFVVGGLLVLALGGLTWAFVTQSSPAPVATPVVAPAPAAPAAPADPPTTRQPNAVEPAPVAAVPAKEEPLPPREEAGASRDKGTQKKTTPSSGSKKTTVAAKNSDEPVAKSEPTAKTEPAPKAEPAAPAAKKGSLDDLLSGAMGTPKKSVPAPTAASPTGAPEAKKSGPLGKSDIVKGMMGIMPKTKACYDQFKVPGTASVNVKVDSSGHVESANVTGKFGGTPTGECVEKAVKTAKFPPSDGLAFPYPIPLR